MAPKDEKRPQGGGGRDRRRQDGRGRVGSGQDRKGRGRRQDGRRDDARRGRSRESITSVPAGELPRWVREEITRTAPKARREPALNHLTRAVGEFADERYAAAYDQLQRAKRLAPQAATIRELLGLSAYHLQRWDEALRELRTFRRISGETTQVPVEIDCLRALGRHADADKTFRQLGDLDPHPATDDEARVVYASDLLDRGEITQAWRVIKPGRLVANPPPSALRRWYVAARVAAKAGDVEAANRFVDAIADSDADFPGLAELREEIASSG